MSIYLLIIRRVRRKPGSLLPLETAICEVASVLQQRGMTPFHGFSIAKELKHAGDTKLLTAYGTLYRALDRLEQMGFLRSEAEDPHIAAGEGRPPRRLYELTAEGHRAIAEAAKADPKARAKRKRGLSTI
jgi:PadR family transcriptional regulator PadR